MWACVNTTASIDAGSTGKGRQFISRSRLTPWNNPQSTSTRAPAASTTNREPVTVSAAPQNVTRMVIDALSASEAEIEAANRWYSIVARGASGKDIRQLFERQGALVSRVLRLSMGSLKLEKDLVRGQFRQLEEAVPRDAVRGLRYPEAMMALLNR